MLRFTRFTVLLLICLVFCLGWALVLELMPEKDTVWNHLYNLVFASVFLPGGILGVYSGMKFGLKSIGGKALFFLGWGLISWSVGLVIWVGYNLILRVDVPYPSWSDLFFSVLFYPFVGVGYFYTVRLFTAQIPKRYLIDSIIIVSLSTVAVFGFFSQPDLSADLPVLEKILNVVYPAGDVLLVSIASLALRIYKGKIPMSLLVLIVGLLLKTVADFMFSYLAAANLYWNGDISDVTFTFAGFCMSWGIWGIKQNLMSGVDQTVKK